MSFLLSLLLSAVAVMLAAYITPGAQVSNLFTALLVAIALGFLNAIVKPVLLLLTLPINILTLGLFTLVINVLILSMVDALIPGFSLGGFFPALLFAIVLSVINMILFSFFPEKEAGS